MNQLLTDKTIKYIHDKYYTDISKALIWDNLLWTCLKNNDDLPAKIELMAGNGIINLNQYMLFALNAFDHLLKQMITINDDASSSSLKLYFCLLCMLHGINVKHEAHLIEERTHKELLQYLKSDDCAATLQLIYAEHESALNVLFSSLKLDHISSFNAIDTLRELLSLPYLNSSALKTHAIINIDTHHAVISTVQLFLYVRQLYLLQGAKKSFGYYQRLLDPQIGNVLYSINFKNQMFLLKGNKAPIAGQANIENIDLLKDGNILIQFRVGAFSDNTLVTQGAFHAALAISEALFNHLYLLSQGKSHTVNDMLHIYLESPDDNDYLPEQIKQQLIYFNPDVKANIKVVPSLKNAAEIERQKYLSTDDVVLCESEIKNIIDNIKVAGHKHALDLSQIAFDGVKLITLDENEVLFQENDPSLFVYIPCDAHLIGYSNKSNTQFFPIPWAPIGHIGVIQNQARSATIKAEKKLTLYMIPKNTYLRYWHADYDVSELKDRLHVE